MDDATMLSRLEWVMNISLFLVAIGVAGEFIGNQIAGPIRRRLDGAKEAEIARLNKEAGEARKAAGEAIERSASLEKQAEGERLARVRIEERLALRRIDEKQQKALVAALKSHAGARVDVFKLMADVDAEPFADEIIRILKESGWDVIITAAEVRTPPVYGLQCVINNTLPAGRALAEAFKSLPTAHIVSNPNLPIAAEIVVGLKPPYGQQ